MIVIISFSDAYTFIDASIVFSYIFRWANQLCMVDGSCEAL